MAKSVLTVSPAKASKAGQKCQKSTTQGNFATQLTGQRGQEQEQEREDGPVGIDGLSNVHHPGLAHKRLLGRHEGVLVILVNM